MNKQHVLLLFLSFISTACASTYLIDKDGKTNYSISTVEEKTGLKTSRFDGNQYTPVSRSRKYSRLGAILECSNKQQLAFMIETSDHSSNFTQLETTTTVTPMRLRGGTYYHSYSNTVPRTTTFPHHVTYYKCVSKLQTIDGAPTLETLGREIVNPYAGDFKGGVLVKAAGDNKILRENDLIVKINNERIESTLALTLIGTDLPEKADLDIYRGKKAMKVSVALNDLSDTLKAQVAKETLEACEQVRNDQGKIPAICTPPKKSQAAAATAKPVIDESKLSNKEIRRLRNQQEELE